jgi:hypothetical protein
MGLTCLLDPCLDLLLRDKVHTDTFSLHESPLYPMRLLTGYKGQKTEILLVCQTRALCSFGGCSCNSRLYIGI